jgi:hypothetical protein
MGRYTDERVFSDLQIRDVGIYQRIAVAHRRGSFPIGPAHAGAEPYAGPLSGFRGNAASIAACSIFPGKGCSFIWLDLAPGDARNS